MTRAPSSLRLLQEWFAGATTHPGSLEEGALRAPHAGRLGVDGVDGVGRVLTAGPLASAMDRLRVYHDAYLSRLVECLADDYPALRDALGEGPFDLLCRGYAEAHPSRSFSLNHFGRHMPEHVRTHGGENAAFASELARLEWAIVEAIRAPSQEVMGLDALEGVAPESWAGARMPASGMARVLRFEHPVNRYFQAFRDGEARAIPAPEASVTAVSRRGYVVWRTDMTPAMADVLEALFGGATLEQALATHPTLPEGEVAAAFRDWVAGGFFARVATDARAE